MVPKKSIFRMFFVFLVIVLTSSIAYARPLAAVTGTGFSYQGKLTDGGVSANGVYDLEFKLYDALSGGIQVGSTLDLGDVTVTNGLFTVQLDFGDVFDGTAYFLEIGVRPGGSLVAYTALTPRQALSATPYAIYAAKAPWGGLSGVPAGFADGIDNGSAYQNVKIVAQSGGDFTTINAALASITDASASNRYLVWVAPGVYTERVTMKQYVDIEGAGELTTKITYFGDWAEYTGTVVGASDAELRLLSVETTGGNAYSIAIYNNGNSGLRLTHVTVSASGATSENFGVYNKSSALTMTNVNASATDSAGGFNSTAVANIMASSVTMVDVTASGMGGAGAGTGVYNSDSPNTTMTNVTAKGTGGSETYGVRNSSSSSAMTNVVASASGGTFAYGVANSYSSPAMMNVTASASGGTTNYGVNNSDFCSPAMTNVTANASGGSTNYGVHNYNNSSPAMTSITTSASGGSYNYGVYNESSSSPAMTNVTASGAAGTTSNYGVYNYLSSPFMTNMTASGTGGLYSYGVTNNYSSPSMTNVTASAVGGAYYNYGVSNEFSGSPTISNSTINARGGNNNYGIYIYNSGGIVRVNNSQINAITSTIWNAFGFTVRVGASQLNGGAANSGGGTLTCTAVYDENYVAYASTCP